MTTRRPYTYLGHQVNGQADFCQ